MLEQKIFTAISCTARSTVQQEDKNDVVNRKRPSFHLSVPKRPQVIGRVYVCGTGYFGQLGLGNAGLNLQCKQPNLVQTIPNAVDIVAGALHSLVLTHDGRVFTFGNNNKGALGRDTSENGSAYEPIPIKLPGRAVKIAAGDSHSACIIEGGHIFAWGSFCNSQGNMGLTLAGSELYPVNIMPGVACCDIVSGAEHLVILTCAGKVYTLGGGEQGQLGRISLRSASGLGRRGKKDLLTPGLVFIQHNRRIDAIWATDYTTFLRESQTGVIWAFGLNNCNQLTVGTNFDSVANPLRLKLNNVKQVAGGQYHTLVLKTDGTVYAIGCSYYGRLGLGIINDDVTTLTPIRAFKNKVVVSVSCGEATSFALTQNGELYAWGIGSNYQLGIGISDNIMQPTQISHTQRFLKVSSGCDHSIFLVEDELQPANVKKDILTLNNGNITVERQKHANLNNEEKGLPKTKHNYQLNSARNAYDKTKSLHNNK